MTELQKGSAKRPEKSAKEIDRGNEQPNGEAASDFNAEPYALNEAVVLGRQLPGSVASASY